MSGFNYFISLFLVILFINCKKGNEQVPKNKRFYPVEIDSVIFTPDPIGFVLGDPEGPYNSFPENAWFKKEKVSRLIHARVTWAYLEPSEGQYRWDAPNWEPEFKTWVDNGYKVSIRPIAMQTCGNLYSGGYWPGAKEGPDGTPQWVFDSGADYIDWNGDDFWEGKSCGVTIREPVYWDEVFLQKAINFIKALGARYNNYPGIVSVEMGLMGRWGELHLDGSPFNRYADKGYSRAKYIETHARLCDAYKQAFPDKLIIQPIDDPEMFQNNLETEKEIVKNCVSRGIIIKNDGYAGDDVLYCLYYLQDNYKKVQTMWELINRVDIIGDARLEAQNNYTYQNCHVSTLWNPFDVGVLVNPPTSLKKSIMLAAKYFGYRFVLQKIEYPDTLIAGSSTQIKYTWINKGSAPCYSDYGYLLALVDNSEKTVWQTVMFPNIRTNNTELWDRGMEVKDSLQWVIPKSVASGTYHLRVGMQSMTDSTKRVEFAIKGKDNARRYEVGSVIVQNSR